MIPINIKLSFTCGQHKSEVSWCSDENCGVQGLSKGTNSIVQECFLAYLSWKHPENGIPGQKVTNKSCQARQV